MVYRSQQATKFVIGCGLVLAATVAGGLIGAPSHRRQEFLRHLPKVFLRS